eukprot:COSAG02_NODE_6255_length_3695_cov_16.449291_3_plen_779_part_01
MKPAPGGFEYPFELENRIVEDLRRREEERLRLIVEEEERQRQEEERLRLIAEEDERRRQEEERLRLVAEEEERRRQEEERLHLIEEKSVGKWLAEVCGAGFAEGGEAFRALYESRFADQQYNELEQLRTLTPDTFQVILEQVVPTDMAKHREMISGPLEAFWAAEQQAEIERLRRDAEGHFDEGNRRRSRREYGAAIDALEAGLSLDFQSDELRGRLEASLSSARSDLAAQESARTEARAHASHAEACMSSHDYRGAVESYQAAVALDVNDGSLAHGYHSGAESARAALSAALDAAHAKLAEGRSAVAAGHWQIGIDCFNAGLSLDGMDDEELRSSLRAAIAFAEEERRDAERLQAEQKRVDGLKKRVDGLKKKIADIEGTNHWMESQNDPQYSAIIESNKRDIAKLRAEIAKLLAEIDGTPPPRFHGQESPPVHHGIGSGGMGGGAISAEAQAKITKLKRRIAGDQANIDLLESMGEDTQVLKAGLQKLKQDLEQEEHRVHTGGSQAYQAPVVGMPTGDLAGGPPAYQAPAASPPHYQAPVASPPQYPAAGVGGGPPAYQYQAPMVPVPVPSPVPSPVPAPAPLSSQDQTHQMLGVEQVKSSGSSGLSAEMLSRRLETTFGLRVTPEDLVRVVGACSSASDRKSACFDLTALCCPAAAGGRGGGGGGGGMSFFGRRFAGTTYHHPTRWHVVLPNLTSKLVTNVGKGRTRMSCLHTTRVRALSDGAWTEETKRIFCDHVDVPRSIASQTALATASCDSTYSRHLSIASPHPVRPASTIA